MTTTPRKPTGKLAFAYQTIATLEQARADLEAENARLREALEGANEIVKQTIAAATPPAQQPQAEAVPSIDALEQEIYENTREFVSRSVMEWMLKRYYGKAPQQAEAVPPGYVLVPVEPTDEMIDAACAAVDDLYRVDFVRAYEAAMQQGGGV